MSLSSDAGSDMQRAHTRALILASDAAANLEQFYTGYLARLAGVMAAHVGAEKAEQIFHCCWRVLLEQTPPAKVVPLRVVHS